MGSHAIRRDPPIFKQHLNKALDTCTIAAPADLKGKQCVVCMTDFGDEIDKEISENQCHPADAIELSQNVTIDVDMGDFVKQDDSFLDTFCSMDIEWWQYLCIAAGAILVVLAKCLLMGRRYES